MPKRTIRWRRRVSGYAVGGLLLLPALCLATEVRVVAVTPGQSADVVIDGGTAITIDVGQTVEGVRVLGVDRNGAVLSVNGVRKLLPLVAERSALGDATGSDTVTLTADPHGQFFASGVVNGRPVRFIVDTGATLTTLSRADARRLGLDFQGGTPVQSSTVNGMVKGWRVSLDSLRVEKMTVRNVDAMVVDNDLLPIGLLGMSFLGRFDMQRQGSTLVLRRRR
jgi:aspartyl protease family protein